MNTAFEKYLNIINRHLRPLPASERADIIKEIKGSILEMEGEQLSENQILERLGAPKELAKAYLGEHLDKGKGISPGRLLAVLSFYGLTGISGMFVIPLLGLMAPMLILIGLAAPVAGFFKLIFSLFGRDLPYVVVQFGQTTLSPAPAFLFSVVMGAVLIFLGKGAWKLLLSYIRTVSRTKKNLEV